jgi:hypothetical protein
LRSWTISGAGDPDAVDPVAGAGAPVASSDEPQEPQNRLPGGFAAPQTAQVTSSDVPHEPQNRNPSGFAVPHDGQVLSVTSPFPASV